MLPRRFSSLLLEIEHVNKSYWDDKQQVHFPVFSDVMISINENQFVSILGPSGCGKSTLLSMIAGLEETTEGTIKLNREPISGPGPDRGMVFQQPSLLPWLNVKENILFPIKKRFKKKEAEEQAAYFLQLVQLDKFQHHYIHELSGGMQQRVAIARALAMNPKILLMDEPFAALDEQTRENLQDKLLAIWQKKKQTILFVTHSIKEALILSDRVIVMGTNPGRIISDVNINLSRPRKREDEQIIILEKKIRKLLKNEVNKALKDAWSNEIQNA